MKKPKIAVINAGPISLFTTSFRALSLIKNLSDKYEMHFIVSYNKEDQKKYGDKYEGVFIYYADDFNLRFRRFNPLFLYRIFKGSRERFKLLEEIEPSLIHVFKPLPIAVIPAIKYSRKYNVPFILDIDDAEFEMGKASGSISFMELLMIRHYEENTPYWCNYLTVASKFFYKKYTSSVKKIAYIPNGVDVGEFRKNIKATNLGFKKRNSLLYLGTMLKCFDADLAINIFERVAKKFPNLQLTMVGTGPYLNNLKKMAKEKGFFDKVKFIGQVDHEKIPALLSSSSVLLLPLRDNYINQCRCPVKIAEYMASGKPAVFFDVGEAGIALKNVALGCKPNDFDCFSESVVSLLKNSEKAKNLAKKARLKAIKEYSWGTLSCELDKVYDSFFR